MSCWDSVMSWDFWDSIMSWEFLSDFSGFLALLLGLISSVNELLK